MVRFYMIIGPLVLALYPALGVGQLARNIHGEPAGVDAWGIIYAIISQLVDVMSANNLNSIFTSQSFGGRFRAPAKCC